MTEKRWSLCATCHFVGLRFNSELWGTELELWWPTPRVVTQTDRLL